MPATAPTMRAPERYARTSAQKQAIGAGRALWTGFGGMIKDVTKNAHFSSFRLTRGETARPRNTMTA